MWLPPILVQLIKPTLPNKPSPLKRNTFEGVYDRFDQIPGLTHYDSKSSLECLETEIHNKLEIHEAGSSLPVAHVLSQTTNLLPLLIASVNNKPIRVLDLGGGGGATYLDILESIQMSNVEYFVHDLPETMDMGRRIFSKLNYKKYDIRFVDDWSYIDTLDIVYLGSALQYLPDYQTTLLDLIKMKPKWFLLTDYFMGEYPTYATAQVNMRGRRMAFRVFQLAEIVTTLANDTYQLVYKSTNYQPFHHFDNFPPECRIKDSCNLLFKRVDS